jgi:hypothetical protein
VKLLPETILKFIKQTVNGIINGILNGILNDSMYAVFAIVLSAVLSPPCGRSCSVRCLTLRPRGLARRVQAGAFGNHPHARDAVAAPLRSPADADLGGEDVRETLIEHL